MNEFMRAIASGAAKEKILEEIRQGLHIWPEDENGAHSAQSKPILGDGFVLVPEGQTDEAQKK